MSADSIRIIEVALRDGLQNEKVPIPTELKTELVRNLAAAGLREIELTSFVSPKWVPQLADSAELIEATRSIPGVRFTALVPNVKGVERAIESGIPGIALFTAASEDFVRNNINMSIAESLDVFKRVIDQFRAARPGGFVRGYVSTVVECPIAGKIAPAQVGDVAQCLADLGVDEISLGETIGVAVPDEIEAVADAVEVVTDKSRIVWHFHDTRGTAIANVAAMLDRGYRAFDSSAAGLGGCPYAKGAGGNLATEDLVFFAERSGLATGVDLQALASSSRKVLEALGRPASSKSQLAVLAACK